MFGRVAQLPEGHPQIDKNKKKLITKAVEKAFEKQGYVGDKSMKEIKTVVKFFSPYTGATWWLYEKEDDDIYWAFVNLGDPMCAECGTVSLTELASLMTFGAPTVERDRFYTPEILEDVINKTKASY